MIELIILLICTILMLLFIYNKQFTENFDNIYLKTLKFNKVFNIDNILNYKISDLFN